MKTQNINQYIQELERTISLLNSDNNAIKQIKETFYKENQSLKKELVDIKSKKAQVTKERRTFEIAYKSVKNRLKEENSKLRKEVEWLEKENEGLKESLNFYQTKDN
tara:strand:+ start:51 stop:371 length:321 start_codon:yes stop_codon:yes gene_type:complete